MKNKFAKKGKGILCGFVGAGLYATTATVAKLASNAGVGASTMLFDRYLFAFIICISIALYRKCSLKITRSQIPLVLVVCLASALFNLAYNEVYLNLTGVVASVISLSYVFFILIIDIILKRTQCKVNKILAILFSAFGLIALSQLGHGNAPHLGTFIIGILASILYAAHLIIIDSKPLMGLSLETIFICTTLPVFLTSGLNLVIAGEPLFVETGEQWLYITVLSIFNIYLSKMAFFYTVKIIGASATAIIDMSGPISAGIFAYILLGEKLSAWTIIGTVLFLMAATFSYLDDIKMIFFRNKREK